MNRSHPRGHDVSQRDIVFLRDLRIDTVIGIYDWERRMRQTVILDLEMSADVAAAAKTEDIADALNYKAVAKRLIQFVGDSRYQLVETLAERCAEIIRQEFGVRWVRLTLNKKGAVRGASDVGVVIERGERP
jgi:dihydroneopterin aldolase